MLITDEYRKANEQMHREYASYGNVAATATPGIVAKLMNEHKIGELLDYGAGKLGLAKALNEQRLVRHPFRYIPYEPANEKYSGEPDPCEFVVCNDVLEHIEPDCLEDVLDDLRRVTTWLAFISIHCGPAVKKLPDGRNAHLIQEPPEWWLPKLMQRFDVQMVQRNEQGFIGLYTAKEVR